MKNRNNNNNNKANKNGFIPNSFKFISSYIKTVSTNVRSAGASVAASISSDAEAIKDQVLWASFDRLELGPSSFKHVLLLGYSNGFQVLDVEDASNVSELVSRRDDPVTFLQMLPIPAMSEGCEGFKGSHPLLLVVAGDETKSSGVTHDGKDGSVRDGYSEPQTGSHVLSPTAVRFYSLSSHNYVHVLRFRSTVYMVRCSPRIVAVGLASQIYCFDALTLENKFSVLTYPVPQLGSQGMVGVNIGYGPMAVGPRWLAYASNNPLSSNTSRLSSQSLTPPGVSPSTSPGNGSLMARYAMESSKQLASGLINLGDMGYKTLSKYCQELLPDGSSSPVSSPSSWKVGRVTAHSIDLDPAGMVVIKDFVSRAIVSQFRAHTSPISALCFDPSGTLLVTASIHGHNINIFRIMPSRSQNGSGTQSYDWNSSHVHLYKLHRGMTPAVIQDICFSHYSQWVAIVSSRGTCHVFVLSPFGGDAGLQIQNSHDRTTLLPVLSQPWWSTSSFLLNQQSFLQPPPPPVTLSVVSRIKCNNSGWLNTVSNVASSAAGRVCVPSGAVAAVFHSSIPHNMQPASRAIALENLLAYTPSGHVIQYELLSSVGGESNEASSSTGPGSAAQVQDDEFRVKVEPVQWWDVCRRVDWPEREECISGVTLGRQETAEITMDSSDCKHNNIAVKSLAKPQERVHLYISNAEVHISSGRIAIWQKPKIYFYAMVSLEADDQIFSKDYSSGEIEIEKVPVHEVEIRRKDLLPVFDQFHRIQSDWSGRGLLGEKYSSSFSEPHQANDNVLKGAIISHSNFPSHGLVENSEEGSSTTTEPILNLYRMDMMKSSPLGLPIENDGGKSVLSKRSFNYDSVSISPKQSNISSLLSLKSGPVSTGRNMAKKVHSSNSVEVSNISSIRSGLSMNSIDAGRIHESVDFEPYFQEEYYKASCLDGSPELGEGVTDVDSSSSPCDREKSDEDGENDNDDMLGGVFDFSEEG